MTLITYTNFQLIHELHNNCVLQQKRVKLNNPDSKRISEHNSQLKMMHN